MRSRVAFSYALDHDTLDANFCALPVCSASATTRIDVATVDRSTVPAVDIDRSVQLLSKRADALEAAARRQDELTAADHPGSLGELLGEVRG